MKRALCLLTAGIIVFALASCNAPVQKIGGNQSTAPSMAGEVSEPDKTTVPIMSTELTETPKPTATPTATQPVAMPTEKPETEQTQPPPPTETPLPTTTSKPAATPKPTATPAPASTPTPTPAPTATPAPTPTPTAEPTATPEPTATLEPTSTPEPEMEVLGSGFKNAVLAAVNETRADYGNAPLRLDSGLCAKALAHAKEMALRGEIFHSCGGAESVSNSSESGRSIGIRSAAHATGLALDADRSRLGVGSVRYNGKQYTCVFSPRD